MVLTVFFLPLSDRKKTKPIVVKIISNLKKIISNLKNITNNFTLL